MDIDKSKENIQPLRGGRNVLQLGTALQAQSDAEAQRRLILEKEDHENLIRNYNGPDPLEPWFSYIQWVEQSFPKHGHEGHMDKLIKDCLQKFEKDERYTQDRRFVKLWIKYIDCLLNPLEVYQLLYNNGIGTRCSELYRAWACYCQEACDYKRAMRVFELGLDADAQPRDELEEAHINFQLFYARRMLLDDSSMRRRGENNLSETRAALTSLRGVKRRGDSQPVRAPQLRIGPAILSSRPGVVPQTANGPHSSQLQSNVQLTVYQDVDTESRMSYAPSTAGQGRMPSLSLVAACSEEQNQREVGLWSGAHAAALVPRARNTMTEYTTPFTLYEDDGIILSANHKPYCLDDLSTFKVPLSVPDPDDNTKIPRYNKAAVYCDGTEYSLEEIRSRRYLVNRSKNETCEEILQAPDAPSPVLLCNLDSQELTAHGITDHPAVVNEYRNSLLADLHSDSITVNTRELIRKAFNDEDSMLQPIAQPVVRTFDILEEPTENILQNIKSKQIGTVDNGHIAMDIAMDTNHINDIANKENGPVRTAPPPNPATNNETRLLNETCSTQMFNFNIPIASTPNTAQFKKPVGQRQAPAGGLDTDGLSDIMETTEYRSSSSSSGANTARTNTILSNATDGRTSLSQQTLTPAGYNGNRFHQQFHRTPQNLNHSQTNGFHQQNVNNVRNSTHKQDIHNAQHHNIVQHTQDLSHVQQNLHQHQTHPLHTMAGAQNANMHVSQPQQPVTNHALQNLHTAQAQQMNQHYQQNQVHLHQQNHQQPQINMNHLQQQQQQQIHQQHYFNQQQQQIHQQQNNSQQRQAQQMPYGNWGYQSASENYTNSPQPAQQRVLVSPAHASPTSYQQMHQKSPQSMQHSFNQASYQSPNYQQYPQYQQQQQQPQYLDRTQPYVPERSFNMYSLQYQMKPPQSSAPAEQTFDAYNQSIHLSFAQRNASQHFSEQIQSHNKIPHQTQSPSIPSQPPTTQFAIAKHTNALQTTPQSIPSQPVTPQLLVNHTVPMHSDRIDDQTSNQESPMQTSPQICQLNQSNISSAARLRSIRPDSVAGFSDQFLSFITSRNDPKDSSEANSPNISQKMHKNLYVSSPEQSQMAVSRPSSEHGSGSQPDLTQSNAEKNKDLSKRQLDFEGKPDFLSEDSRDSLGRASQVSSLDSGQAPQSMQTYGDSENSMDCQAYKSICSNSTVETHEIPRPANIDFPKIIDPFNKNICNALLEYVQFPNKTHCEGYYEVKFLPKLQQNTAVSVGGHRFSVEKQIGNGTFGSVFRCVDLASNNAVALKYQKPGHPWEFYICQEIKARVKDPFMLPGYIDIRAAFLSDNASIFVSELSKYGSLLDVANKIKIATTKCISEPIVMLLTCEILSIMHHLHKSQIVHADIKPDNFLLMQIPTMEWRSPSLQLIDLGCAIDMSLFPEGTTFTKVITTDGFTCDEMRQKKPWTYQTDLYCIAGTIHVLLFGSYMKTTTNNGKQGLERKWPRYMKQPMWENLFSALLNVQDCWSQPDLLELKIDVESALRDQESNLTSQLRTFTNILKSR